MIKVNLLEEKQQVKIPKIMGVEIGEINFKLVILVGLVSCVPDFTFKPAWEKERAEVTAEINGLKAEQKRLQQISNKDKNIQKKIKAFVEQEQELKEKLSTVKNVIKLKKNPMDIMLYVSKNIPQDVWIDIISMEQDKLKISGSSTSYRSIGLFLDSLKSSIFFQEGDPRLVSSKSDVSKRTEVFTLEAQIKRYE